MLPPSYAITKGHPPDGAVPEGKVMVFVHEIVLPPLPAVIDRVPVVPDLLNVAVNVEGLGGNVPAS